MLLTDYVVPAIALTAAVMGAFVIVIVALSYRKHHTVGGNAWILLMVAFLLFGFSFWQSFDINASRAGFSMKVRAKLADIAKIDTEFTKLLASLQCFKSPAEPTADQTEQENLRKLVDQREQVLTELVSLLERDQRTAPGGNQILVTYIVNGTCVAGLLPAEEVDRLKKEHKLC
jgi:hypothetical protein